MNPIIQEVLKGGISKLISKFFKKFQRKPQVVININVINNGIIQNLNIDRVD